MYGTREGFDRESLCFRCFFLFAPALVASEVYRCEDEDGAVTYSQQPCADDAEVISLDVEGDAPPEPEVDNCHEVATQVVEPGMTHDEVLEICGAPRTNNATRSEHGNRWQWVYRVEHNAAYVYLEQRGGDVVVTSVSD